MLECTTIDYDFECKEYYGNIGRGHCRNLRFCDVLCLASFCKCMKQLNII